MKWGTPVILGLVVLGSATAGFAQSATQDRIPQQIVINGQAANGAYVLTANGGIQNYSCAAPQVYATPDGATNGWACQDPSTGVWLLGALPPQNAAQPVPVQPPVQQVIQQAAPPPTLIYQTSPVYVPAPPQVVYVTPQPQVIYRQPPAVIYSVPPVRSVVVQRYPQYPSSVYLGAATIEAVGRVAAAAIGHSRTIEVIDHRDGRGDRSYGRDGRDGGRRR